MSVAAVSTVFNEADVIGSTIQHLWNEGVDRILVADASTDGTTDILHDLGVEVLRDTARYHYQPTWINVLAQESGCDWIVPFDADEFWFPLANLRDVPLGVTRVYARMFQHLDWDRRFVDPAPHPKVAFHRSQTVSNGNHYARGPGGEVLGLEVRELHFRSFAHMCVKSTERVERIDPALSESEGAHQRRLHAMRPEDKRRAWAEWLSRPTVFDPIPSSAVRVAVDLSEPS